MSYAASFIAADKSSLQIADGDQSGLDLGSNDGSVSLMAYPTASTAGGLLGKGATGTADGGFQLALDSSRKVTLTFGDGSGAALITKTFNTALTLNAWNSLVLTLDRDGNATLYLNGASDGTADISAQQASINSTGAFTLGAVGTSYYAGRLGYGCFLSRLFTPAEIARRANMADGVPHARPYANLNAAEKVGLVSAWDMQDGPWSSTQQAMDLHGSNHLSFTAANIIDATTLNGGFETWTTPTNAANWTESVSGSSTINQEAVTPYAGAYACRMDVDEFGAYVGISQDVLTSGKTYTVSCYHKCTIGASTFGIFLGTRGTYFAADESYHQWTVTDYASGGTLLMRRGGGVQTNRSHYFDNVTLTAANLLTAEGPLLKTGNRRRRLLICGAAA